jgi:hypothetical protein
MMAPEVRQWEIVSRLPAGALRGAEIGVFKGQLSALLLHALPALKLYMVDSWAPTEEQPEAYKACGDFHALLPGDRQEMAYRKALTAIQFAMQRAVILRMDSVAAAARVDDGSLDFVFIDGDHSYDGCWRDILHWTPKLKKGGLLCGHDYDHPLKPAFGVKRAVDAAVSAYGWSVEFGKDMTWFVRP